MWIDPVVFFKLCLMGYLENITGSKSSAPKQPAVLAAGRVVCAASVSEKMGAKCLLRYLRRSFMLRELCSQVELVWVDGGYRGEDLRRFAQRLWGWCW